MLNIDQYSDNPEWHNRHSVVSAKKVTVKYADQIEVEPEAK